MIKQPYIFFDVDGVLNCEKDWRGQHFSINDNCLSVFNDFVESVKRRYKCAPILIICSTWRAGFTCTNQNGPAMSALEKRFNDIGLKISGATPVSNKTRQEEIEYYIRRNNITDYIVIDDDISLYGKPEKINLYMPDYRSGLTEKDSKLMLKQFISWVKRR